MTSLRHTLPLMAPLTVLLPMLPVTMPLPSESCLDGRRRPLLVSSLQLVRAFPTLRQVKAVWTKLPISAKYPTLPLLPVKSLKLPRLAACSRDSPRL